MNFATRLKQLRAEKGLTQQELGVSVGMNSITISDYERGKKDDPLMSSLRRLSAFFEVSIDYLVGDTDLRNQIGLAETVEAYKKLSPEAKTNALQYIKFIGGDNNEDNPEK